MILRDFEGVLPEFTDVAVHCSTYDNKENESLMIVGPVALPGTSFGSLCNREDPWYLDCEITNVYAIRTESSVNGTTICFQIKKYIN